MNKAKLLQPLMKRNSAAAANPSFRPPTRQKFALPATIFEFQPEYILGAQIARTSHKVTSVALGDLEPGSLTPQLNRPNVLKPEEVGRRVVAVARVLGSDKGPFGVLLPDAVVRVSILDFETLPPERKEQESLVRWKMKSLLAFPVDEARLSFEIAAKEPKGVQAVVMAVRKSVVAEYEAALESLNGEVRLLLPSSAALLPLLNENAPAGELLLNITPTQLTAVVARGHQIRLWRNQPMVGKTSEEGLVSVGEEAVRTLAAAHDHLGLEIDQVRICARPGVPDRWEVELGSRLSREVKDLNPSPRSVGIKLSDEESQILGELGATVCGLVANAG